MTLSTVNKSAVLGCSKFPMAMPERGFTMWPAVWGSIRGGAAGSCGGMGAETEGRHGGRKSSGKKEINSPSSQLAAACTLLAGSPENNHDTSYPNIPPEAVAENS